MLLNIYSSLTACHPNIDHLQRGLHSGLVSQPHLLKAYPVCIFPRRHCSKVSQETLSPVYNNPSHLAQRSVGALHADTTLIYGKKEMQPKEGLTGHLSQVEVVYQVWTLIMQTASAVQRHQGAMASRCLLDSLC